VPFAGSLATTTLPRLMSNFLMRKLSGFAASGGLETAVAPS